MPHSNAICFVGISSGATAVAGALTHGVVMSLMGLLLYMIVVLFCLFHIACSSGALLASATTSVAGGTEQAGTWNHVRFASAASLTSGTYYIVSYTCIGVFAQISNVLLGSAVTYGVWSTPAAGGRFSGSVGTFPSTADTNYWGAGNFK